MRILYLLAAIIGIASPISNSHAAEMLQNGKKNGLTVQDILLLTLQNDQRIAAARYNIEIARADLSDAKSYFRPKINGIGRVAVNKVPDRLGFFGNTAEDGKSIYGGVEVEQQVLSFGRYSAMMGEGRAGVDQARYQLQAEENEILMEAVRAYLDYARTKKTYTAYTDYAADMADLLKRTKDKFDNQLIGRSEYLLVRSRWQQARANVTSTENDITRAYQRLAKLINKRQFDITADQVAFYQGNTPKTLALAIDQAQENDPRLKAAREISKAKKNAAQLAKANLHPKISLQGSVVRGKLEQRQTGEAIVGLNVELPIYNGGSGKARLRRAKSDASRAQALLSDEVANSEERVTAAWKILNSQIESEKMWLEAFQAETQAVDELKKEVDTQIRSLIVLLEAREQLVTAEVNAIAATYSRLTAGYELLTAMGKLPQLINP